MRAAARFDELVPRLQRVFEVLARRIVRADRRRDPPLGVAGVRFFQARLGHDRRPEAELSAAERDVESRNAASDDERAPSGLRHGTGNRGGRK